MASKPRCPNHDVELTQCGFPLPAKGQGVCPVSGATFAFEVDVGAVGDELKLDSSGKVVVEKKYKIEGSD